MWRYIVKQILRELREYASSSPNKVVPKVIKSMNCYEKWNILAVEKILNVWVIKVLSELVLADAIDSLQTNYEVNPQEPLLLFELFMNGMNILH